MCLSQLLGVQKHNQSTQTHIDNQFWHPTWPSFDSQQHSHFIFMDLYVTNFSHNPAIREMQQNSKDFKIHIAITQKK